MLPRSVNQLTVSQYMQCVDIYSTPDLDVLDREILILSKLTGKSEQYYSEMPIGKLKQEFRKVPVLSLENLKCRANKYIFIRGWLYKAVLDPSEINKALFTDLKTYLDKGIDKNLNKIMACIYRPVLLPYNQKTFERTSRLMLNQKIGDVCGAVFFYSDLFKRLNPGILTFLKRRLEEIQKMA